MNIETIPDQGALETQLLEVRERLEGLDRDLRAVDAELEALAADRARYQLLQDACDALTRLDELDAAELFWGERIAGEKSAEHLRRVRARVEVFQQGWGEVYGRRDAVVEQIRHAEEALEIVEEALFQAQQQEERRKLEWVVEREISALPARQVVMPWMRGGEDDRRFRRSLASSLLACLLVGVLVSLVELPLPEIGEPIEVPERLARLVEQRLPPPPPPVREDTRPEEPKPVVEPEPVQQEQEQPRVAQAPTPPPVAEPTPTRRPEASGILAFREKFSSLADNRPSAQLGAEARISGAGQEASGRPERSMVTTQAPGSSGGINLASLSRGGGGGGGGGMAGVEVTRASSSIGGGGGDGRPTAGGGGASAARTDEEIQIVFDRHKAALYRLYNRELRRDPTLRGQMVLRIRIEPDGRVSICELQSTDMRAPELSAQVVERVMTFNFGAKDVPPVTILYPIDFLPAT